MNNWTLIYLSKLQAAGVQIEIRTSSGVVGDSSVQWRVALHIERRNAEGEDFADLTGRGDAPSLDAALGLALGALRKEVHDDLTHIRDTAHARGGQLVSIDDALVALAGAM